MQPLSHGVFPPTAGFCCLLQRSSSAAAAVLPALRLSPLLRLPILPCLRSRSHALHLCLAASENSSSGVSGYDDPARFEREVDLDEENLSKHKRIDRAAERLRRKRQSEFEGPQDVFLKAMEVKDAEAASDGDGSEQNVDEFLKDIPATLVNRLRKAEAGGWLDATGLQSVGEDTEMSDRSLKHPSDVAALQKNSKDPKKASKADIAALQKNSEDPYKAGKGDVAFLRKDGEDPNKLGKSNAYMGKTTNDNAAEAKSSDANSQKNGEGGEFFDADFARLEKEAIKIEDPSFSTTLTELLDEAGVTPLSVSGDLDAVISGIQHDSREVVRGDLFLCCTGFKTDGHRFAAEAAEKGAAVIVASKEVYSGENVKAIVMVEDTGAVRQSLTAAFYRRPSQKLSVIGITGTNGKTTTSYLLKSMYDCMGIKTGLIGTIAYCVFGEQKLEAPHTTPDAVHLQKLMAKMVHNGTEVCVMEVSSHALALGRCEEVDFDVAVFTNLTQDHMDFHKTEDEYREAKGKLFAKMVDPQRHRKVANIDDPNAGYFVSQGNPAVPVVTFAMRNHDADVYPLEMKFSLFETELLVRTPRGNIEISSGLLGRHNVYNILAAVAVGIAVEAPLENIVRGVEAVDAVPGRFELIDEEQTFAVIVDYAHSPDALARLLDAVRECGAQRIITVIGCGGDRDRGKRPMMAKIATEKSEVSIFTSDNPRMEDPMGILDDMLAGVGSSLEEYFSHEEKRNHPLLRNGHRVYVHDVRSIAIRAAIAMGEDGDAVVIAGKGHENYQLVGTEIRYHDDSEECREALMHVDAVHAAGIDK